MVKREFGILVAVILLCLWMFACTQQEEKAPVANNGMITAGPDAAVGYSASVQQGSTAPTSEAPGYIPLEHMTETFARYAREDALLRWMLPAETTPYIMFMEYATGDVVVFVRKEEAAMDVQADVLAAQLRDGGDGYMGCVQATEYAIGISSASMERGERIQELYAGIAQGRF